jgi:hypothetical protein
MTLHAANGLAASAGQERSHSPSSTPSGPLPTPAHPPIRRQRGTLTDHWRYVHRSISEAGGTATVSQVDALDEGSVDAHADALVRDHGSLDISMNST